MAGGTTAPPAIAVIISPEISFTLSGHSANAIEYIIENIDEAKKPTHPMQTISIMELDTKANIIKDITVAKIFNLK